MSYDGAGFTSFFLPFVWCLALAAVPLYGFAGDPIYKYIEDSGTINFTERWDSIPEKYRSRVETLDFQTLKPLRPGSGTSKEPPPPSVAHPTDEAESFGSTWLHKFSELSIPLPSQFQLAVGLTAGVLIVGVLILRRMSSNPLVKAGLKAAIVLMTTGAIYVVYVSDLNERVSEETGEPAQETTTGASVLRDVREIASHLTGAIPSATVDRVKETIRTPKEATVGQVRRTVEQANAANQQLQKRLAEIDSK